MANKEEITALVNAYQAWLKENEIPLKEVLTYPILRKSFEAIPSVLNYCALNYLEVLLVEEPEPFELFGVGFSILKNNLSLIQEYLTTYLNYQNLTQLGHELNLFFFLQELIAIYTNTHPNMKLEENPLTAIYNQVLSALDDKVPLEETELEQINLTIDKIIADEKIDFALVNDTFEEISLELNIPILI